MNRQRGQKTKRPKDKETKRQRRDEKTNMPKDKDAKRQICH